MWQEWGLPCKHAVAVLKRRNLDLYKFSHDNWRLEKYYRRGITSTQTTEIINGQPGAGRSFFGGWWRYHHPVKMILVSYNWYMRRFNALKEQANGFNDFLTPVGENIIKARIENQSTVNQQVH